MGMKRLTDDERRKVMDAVCFLARQLVEDDSVPTAELVLQILSLLPTPSGIEPWLLPWMLIEQLAYHVGRIPHQAPQVGRLIDEYAPTDCPLWASNLLLRMELSMHHRCRNHPGIVKSMRLLEKAGINP